ncbi:MAG: DUF3656 domain-containing protein [Syntrophomonadaceae bacterium]|jgi:putative protease|nr:DUF3656 domain-containing protein [Syntrophomonadaceae bacterium]
MKTHREFCYNKLKKILKDFKGEKMKLLAPAGNWQAFIAAIANGADIVYLGGKDYSARQSAGNFSTQEIISALEIAHLYNKKIYITINTILQNSELEALIDWIRVLYDHGADALIVQDLGLIYLLRKLFPDLNLHASTQMTVHNALGAKLIKEQGLKQAVLARELSLAEIKNIHAENPDLQLEVFVHGALCYCYSGQCLFSSMVGGRSGNRGRCSQPCRMSYKLIENNGMDTAVEKNGTYLMSTADLCLLDHLKELQNAGVSALKIEGRMKRMEYVAVVTGIYRQVLDQLRFGAEPDTKDYKRDLAQIFNRNFTDGYFTGSQDNCLSSKRPNNRGIYIGRIKNKNAGGLAVIKLKEPLRVSDGIEVWISKGKGPAFIIDEMFMENRSIAEAAAGDEIALKIKEPVNVDDRVFKTHDHQLMMKASESHNWLQNNKLGVEAAVYMRIDAPVRLIFRDDEGHSSEIYSESTAVPAEKYPLTYDLLFDKLSRLGNTCFYLRSLEIVEDEQVMIPFREINKMRRQAITEIMEQRFKPYRYKAVEGTWYEKEKDLLFDKKFLTEDNGRDERRTPYISVAVSNTEQAAAAIEQKTDRIYLYLDGLGNKAAVNKKSYWQILEWGEKNQVEIIPAWPRIQKTEEMEKYIKQAEDWGFTKIMAGNVGALQWAKEHGLKIFADYSFNVFNPFSVKYLQSLGASIVCLSPELNYSQLTDFAGLPVEILVHGEVLLMVAENCMLRSAWGIKEGKPCFKYCKSKAYCLEDEKKYCFPVVTDRNCRNYVFNSRPLFMLDHLLKLAQLKPAGFRIEARLDEHQKLGQIVASYRMVRDQIKKGAAPDRDFLEKIRNSITSGSFTRGHYFRGVQ